VANNHLPIDPMNVEMDNIPQNVGINAYSIMRVKNISPIDGINADSTMRAKDISPLRRRWGTSQMVGSVIRGFKTGVTKWVRNETNIYGKRTQK
jgi:hypothetical protein